MELQKQKQQNNANVYTELGIWQALHRIHLILHNLIKYYHPLYVNKEAETQKVQSQISK